MGDRAGNGLLTYNDGHQLKGAFEEGSFQAECMELYKKKTLKIMSQFGEIL